VTTGEQSSSLFGAGAAGDAAVSRSHDTITDFALAADKVVFVIADSYDSVKVTAALPANLTLAGLVSPVAVAYTGAGNQLTATIGKDAASTGTANDFDNYLIDTTGVNLTNAHVVTRALMSGGQDRVDASLGQSASVLDQTVALPSDTIAVEFVYSAASQSQGGGFDQILNFLSGQDKIDLSFLQLPRLATLGTKYDVGNNLIADAIEAIRVLPSSPLVAFNADAPSLFVDAGGQIRAIATQTTVDANLTPSTTVFIDVNHDGDYTVTQDMVISFVGSAGVALGDFLFSNYDVWGTTGGPGY
jgi:hypothetical protein